MHYNLRPPKLRRRVRILRWVSGIGLFLLLLVSATLMSLHTGIVHDLIRNQANRALAGLFGGQLVVDRVDNIGLWGVSGVEAHVLDPAGREVIRAHDLSAKLSVLGLVQQLVTGGKSTQIRIADVASSAIEVSLFEETGSVSLQSAFLPKVTSEAAPSDAQTDVFIDRIRLAHVRVTGALGGQLIDADVNRLDGKLAVTRDDTALTVASAELIARALPYAADPVITIQAEMHLPSAVEGKISLKANASGTLAEAPVQAQFALDGEVLDGWLNLAPIPSSSVNSRVGGLALSGDSALHAAAFGSLDSLQVNAEITSDAANVDLWAVLQLGDSTDIDLDAIVSGADLSSIVAGAPRSRLDLRLDAHVFQDASGILSGSHHLELLPSLIAGQRTPALLGVGWLASDAQGTSFDGALSTQEQGIDAQTTYRVKLPTDAPTTVRAQLDAQLSDPARLRAFDVRLGSGQVSASGEWRSTGQIALQARSSVDHVAYRNVVVQRATVSARVQGSVENPQATAQVALNVAGGAVRAQGSYNAAQQHAHLTVQNVDVSALTHQLGVTPSADVRLEAGRVDLDLDLTRRLKDISAKLAVTGRALHLTKVGYGDLQADLELSQRQLNGQVQANMGKLGKLDVTVREINVPANLDARGLRQLSGLFTARGKVNLAQVVRLLAPSTLPVEDIGGQLSFDVSAERRSGASEVPSVSLSLHSHGLRVVSKSTAPPSIQSAEVAKASEPLTLVGVDLDLSTEFVPERNELNCVLHVHDKRAPLLSLAATAELPAGRAVYAALAAPAELPIKASVRLPERSMVNLPAALRPQLRGFLSAAIEVKGTLLKPQLDGQLAIRALQALAGGPAIDMRTDVGYTPESGQIGIVALEKGTQIAELRGQWRGDLRKLSEVTERSTPVQASLEGRLNEFPLEVIQPLANRQVKGRISGELKLSDWGKAAVASLQISSRSLVVGQIPLRALTLNARNQADQLHGQVEITLAHGQAQASFESGMRWGERPVPVLGDEASGRIGARDFELSTLQPLLGRYVSELAGKLNGDAKWGVSGNATDVAGSLEMTQGVLQLPALGQRLSDISARVAIANNELRLERLDAAGTTGRLHASGRAGLQGLGVADAQVEVKIKKEQKIPVTLEGVAIGDAWGTVRANYLARANASPELNIDVPQFEVFTPDSGGYDLQALEDNTDIRVGVQRNGGRFSVIPVQPLELEAESAGSGPKQLPLRVRIKLGDVSVQRGTIATAQLSGELLVIVAEPTEIEGRIELRGGQLDVQGKTFEIESGVIAFQGHDASNPNISATARWDSPTDHVVYAEYVGDVKNGRIKLHSEPPLSQDQIASLLLFGTPDGAFGSGETDQASLAVSVAGGTVTQGLNRALSDFTSLDVSARVDTSTGSARPELVFQVTPRLAAKVSRAVGEPTAGQSPDRTFLTLELRLLRAWALFAVVGDRGATALDLIWRRRY